MKLNNGVIGSLPWSPYAKNCDYPWWIEYQPPVVMIQVPAREKTERQEESESSGSPGEPLWRRPLWQGWLHGMSAGATQEVPSAEDDDEEEAAAETTAAEGAVWSSVHTMQRTEMPWPMHCSYPAQGPLVGLHLPRLSVSHLPRLPQFRRCAHFLPIIINPFPTQTPKVHVWPYCGHFQLHIQIWPLEQITNYLI